MSGYWLFKYCRGIFRLQFELSQLILLFDSSKIILNQSFINWRCRLHRGINWLLCTFLWHSFNLHTFHWLMMMPAILLWHYCAEDRDLLVSTLLWFSSLVMMLLLINQPTCTAQPCCSQCIQNLLICWQTKSIEVSRTASMICLSYTRHAQITTTTHNNMHWLLLRWRFMMMRFANIKILRDDWWQPTFLLELLTIINAIVRVPKGVNVGIWLHNFVVHRWLIWSIIVEINIAMTLLNSYTRRWRLLQNKRLLNI